MIKELDNIVLAVDLPEYRLRKGDVGTIVLAHGNHGYEVEFVALNGETLAVVSLERSQVRPIGRGEIANARSVAAQPQGGTSPPRPAGVASSGSRACNVRSTDCVWRTSATSTTSRMPRPHVFSLASLSRAPA